MTQASYERLDDEIVVLPTASTPAVEQVELPWWQGSLLSAVALSAICGVAIGEMALLGVIIHALNPNKVLNIFSALHNQWVVGVLLGITVLWLIPPHPWTKRVIVARSQEQPARTAGETEAGGVGIVTDMTKYQGRSPSHRPTDTAGGQPIG